jgi:hypothetical protein
VDYSINTNSIKTNTTTISEKLWTSASETSESEDHYTKNLTPECQELHKQTDERYSGGAISIHWTQQSMFNTFT